MKRELSNCCCLLPCSASWCFGVFGITRREKRGQKANAEWWWWPLMKRCHVGALRSARDLPGGRSVENEKWIKKNVRSERYAINKVKHTHTHTQKASSIHESACFDVNESSERLPVTGLMANALRAVRDDGGPSSEVVDWWGRQLSSTRAEWEVALGLSVLRAGQSWTEQEVQLLPSRQEPDFLKLNINWLWYFQNMIDCSNGQTGSMEGIWCGYN